MPEQPQNNVDDRIAALGRPISEFRATAGRTVMLFAVSISLIVGGILVYCLVGPFAVRREWGVGFEQVGADIWFPKMFGLIVCLCFVSVLCGIVLAVRAYLHHGSRVLVYPEGIVRTQRRNVDVFFWDEIAAVYEIIDTRMAIEIHGRKYSFDFFLERYSELFAILRRKSLEHLLPSSIQLLDHGGRIDFGDLRFGPDGLYHGQAFLGWAEILEVARDGFTLVIKQKGRLSRPWYKREIAHVPNVHLLRALLEHKGLKRAITKLGV